MKELRLQSGQPGSDFHLAVAVDGVNGLWGRSTIKKEDKSAVRRHSCYSSKMFSGFFYVCHRWKISCVSLSHCYQVDPEELTLIYNLRKLMRNDWVRRAQGIYENIMLKRFSINALSLVLDWRRHYRHSVPDGIALHPQICLLASRAARRG